MFEISGEPDCRRKCPKCGKLMGEVHYSGKWDDKKKKQTIEEKCECGHKERNKI